MQVFRRALGLVVVTAHVAHAAPSMDDPCARQKVAKVEQPDTHWVPGPAGTQIPLWPDDQALTPPQLDGHGEMVGSGSPLIGGRPWHFATYVARPTITVYRPQEANTGTSVLVLPGGGYAAVAMDLEGTEICDWITQQGVTCVVLKYRTPQLWARGDNNTQLPPERLLALEDAQRAVSLLRHRADALGIRPDRIGVMGFSAGALLAAALSNAQRRRYAALDGVDEMPFKPDFAIILYPGRFLPPQRTPTDLTLAPWMTVSANAPPTLLIHAMNDRVNDVRHAIAYGLALQQVGVPVDMRLFAGGCHAFGMRPTAAPITTQWPGLALQWLRDSGVLP